MPTDQLAISYDIYIAAAPETVWNGLVEGSMTKQYVYGAEFQGQLKTGAPCAYVADGGFKAVDGEVLDVEPHKQLVISWSANWDEAVSKDAPSRVSFELTPVGAGATRLRVQHDRFDGETATYGSLVDAWPLLMSSLKSLIETGKPLPS
jgi:uncharacterized protein YndB with AHSA1/START domain